MKLQISKTKTKAFTQLNYSDKKTEAQTSGATVYEHSERILINCQFWFKKKKTWLVPCQWSIVQLTSEFENMCTLNPRTLTPLSTAGNTSGAWPYLAFKTMYRNFEIIQQNYDFIFLSLNSHDHLALVTSLSGINILTTNSYPTQKDGSSYHWALRPQGRTLIWRQTKMYMYLKVHLKAACGWNQDYDALLPGKGCVFPVCWNWWAVTTTLFKMRKLLLKLINSTA